MKKINYSGYRFPSEIIQQAIWLSARRLIAVAATVEAEEAQDTAIAKEKHSGVNNVSADMLAKASLYEAFPAAEARWLDGSWLDMAECGPVAGGLHDALYATHDLQQRFPGYAHLVLDLKAAGKRLIEYQ